MKRKHQTGAKYDWDRNENIGQAAAAASSSSCSKQQQ